MPHISGRKFHIKTIIIVIEDFTTATTDLVSLAAVFSIVTQRSSPQTAAHIQTTFLSPT